MSDISAQRPDTVQAYRRPDGTFGIRNHVAIIGAMDNTNPVVRRIAASVSETVPITAAYGRGQMAEDLAQHDNTLIGFGNHPNVAAALVVGLYSKSAREMAEEIAATGRPVNWVAIQEMGGTVKATEIGIRMAMELVSEASRVCREPCSVSELFLGLECGGSDATSGLTANATTGIVADWIVEAGGTVMFSETEEIMGAEHILAERAASPEVAADLMRAVRECEKLGDFLGMQIIPLGPDNIDGGLTTTEEKSLGAVRKGGTSPLQQVVGYAERPTKKGLIFMDAPAPGAENITSIAASGTQMLLFNTGVGNPIANAISPTLKITGNHVTADHFSDNIDVDVSAIITDGMSLPEAGEILYQAVIEVANGRRTKSEILGDTEITISRVDMGFLRHQRLAAEVVG
ncbi:MAG: UxaA family hydrolase [Rhodospirillaceae bacterium]|jgi:altronate dehydratase large subunit|nr:UxaA family hydrolase [Rhodospirillaceae bacterium]